MTKYLRISSYIWKPFLIYDFATAPTLISLCMRKILFYFLSVKRGGTHRLCFSPCDLLFASKLVSISSSFLYRRPSWPRQSGGRGSAPTSSWRPSHGDDRRTRPRSPHSRHLPVIIFVRSVEKLLL
jgi:hypothetical protein